VKILITSQGKYLESQKRLNRNIFVTLLVIGIVSAIVLGVTEPQLFLLSLMLLLLTVPASLFFLRRYRFWKAGIEGEQKVVVALMPLDDSYFLINDIRLPSSRGNIDHILLNPKGIFALETKNYSGMLRCHGDAWYVGPGSLAKPIASVSKQSKRSAYELSSFLERTTGFKIYVTPICVFVNPSLELTIFEPAVPILRAAELAGFLQQFETSNPLSQELIHTVAQSILKIA
jgi:hypothetical protein